MQKPVNPSAPPVTTSSNSNNSDNCKFKAKRGKYFVVIYTDNDKSSRVIHWIYVSIFLVTMLLFIMFDVEGYYYVFIVIPLIITLIYYNSKDKGHYVISYPTCSFCFVVTLTVGSFTMIVISVYWLVVNDEVTMSIDEMEVSECSYYNSEFIENDRKFIGYGTFRVETMSNEVYYLSFDNSDKGFLSNNLTSTEILEKYGKKDDKDSEIEFAYKFRRHFYQNEQNIYYNECKYNPKTEEYYICHDNGRMKEIKGYCGSCLMETCKTDNGVIALMMTFGIGFFLLSMFLICDFIYDLY